jgi:hypothetical protein
LTLNSSTPAPCFTTWGSQKHRSCHERFELDGADAARDFLPSHGISQQEIDTVWAAIALHTSPGIPQHMHPVVALVTADVEMDVLGLRYDSVLRIG